ncbi:hypothetical protein [Burkholderia glumae]|uniref:hypothetical protein n=1 Tax=Burkholderia glumae TaxID=337 RepID=UPI000381F928|nr:hypothetical protein [Burkholderia glumae]MCM2551865.1 hypothetical protein [Burkholderia glumae]NVE25177.1 hypothetical protein [Burkholderia glumae]PJO22833.1 hypothetical protein Y5A_011935 [Burkholderia glumae AU6208]QGA41213.1 hypothetical protein GAS19_27895 [Burkholderia glumae]QHE13493.1 hypothetical protein GQR88_25040 [Burkholderia glumae AU6208]
MKRHALFCFVLCCATGGGCSPIAYDVRADQQLETLTRDIDSRMIAWRIQAEDGAGAIAYDAGFYAAIEAELAELRIRIGAAPGRSNQDIATTLASLGDQIDRLRRLHRRQNTLDAPLLAAELQLLNAQLATLTTYQLALKHGAPAH